MKRNLESEERLSAGGLLNLFRVGPGSDFESVFLSLVKSC